MIKIVTFESDELLRHVQSGQVIAFPTETVFGLGVRADSKAAFDRLVAVKRRPPAQPFTLMCGAVESIEKYAEVSAQARIIISAFMPGPLTVLLNPRPNLDPWITLDSPTIGIRVPGLPALCRFIEKVGVPLLVPSANKSGEMPCRNIAEIENSFKTEIAYAVDGRIKDAVPSTIVDLSGRDIKVIRHGAITFDMINDALQKGR